MDEPPLALPGKVAAVVGAAGSIGSAIATLFARAGGRVACIDVRAADVVATRIEAAGGEALAITCDITVPQEVDDAIKTVQAAWRRIDVLVNGASADDPTANILDLLPETWARIFDDNGTGAYLVSRAVLPVMIAGGGGAIVHIASQLGHVGAVGRPACCAAKGALLQLARAMAADHSADGVRVNSLSPGAVETQRMVLRHGDMGTARAVSGPKHLAGRLGRPDETASAALFLASDSSSFMTGADLLVDGGYTAT